MNVEIEETVGQGIQFVTDPETHRRYAIPAGGSDGGVSVGDGATEGTVTGEGEGVQSGTPGEGQPPSTQEIPGQGFLEPYLKDVPEEHRGVVQPVLERFRQEQDAQVNRRFEQLQEETKIPVQLHQALIQDPIGTLNWVADRLREEQGLDVREQLRAQWYDAQQNQSGQEPPPQSGQDTDKPLTQAELDRILEEREEQRAMAAQQEQFQSQQAQQQQKTVNGWVDAAAKNFSLPLEEDVNDPLRATIIMQANALHEQGIARGQAAVEMAVEAVAKRLQSVSGSSSNGTQTQQPNLATGGSPPPPPNFDVQDEAQRRARMTELLVPPTQ